MEPVGVDDADANGKAKVEPGNWDGYSIPYGKPPGKVTPGLEYARKIGNGPWVMDPNFCKPNMHEMRQAASERSEQVKAKARPSNWGIKKCLWFLNTKRLDDLHPENPGMAGRRAPDEFVHYIPKRWWDHATGPKGSKRKRAQAAAAAAAGSSSLQIDDTTSLMASAVGALSPQKANEAANKRPKKPLDAATLKDRERKAIELTQAEINLRKSSELNQMEEMYVRHLRNDSMPAGFKENLMRQREAYLGVLQQTSPLLEKCII